jgi:hypothetical protein
MTRDRQGAVLEVFNRFRYRSLTVAAHLAITRLARTHPPGDQPQR